MVGETFRRKLYKEVVAKKREYFGVTEGMPNLVRGRREGCWAYSAWG